MLGELLKLGQIMKKSNTYKKGTCSQVDDCLNTVEHKVTPDMQQILSSDFTTKEIKATVFQMGPTKAPGPDAMNALFYQKFWHIVGDNVVTAVLDYLNSSVLGPNVKTDSAICHIFYTECFCTKEAHY
uniref:Reverse transcriptase n=1 Tax=Quercus lobata TaxID=97700 RepID=A0A7N2MBZ9_QUELO